jgi:hypothetical protein
MLRRYAVVVLLSLFAACARSPVTHELSIQVEPNDRLLVTAQTRFFPEVAQTPGQLSRLEAARFAALHGNDDWATRFGRVTAEDDEVTFERHKGELERVSRSVRIPSRDLQQLLSDTNITVNLLEGNGWRELSFYPGGSMRATREQRRHFDEALDVWSASVARYFLAIDRLYTYLRVNPNRTPDLFNALLQGTNDEQPIVAEEEQPMVDAVVAAMEEIADRMDAQQADATTFAEEADLVYNPFPARMIVRVPGDVISSEGFTKDLVIERIELLETLGALEGKWISPDPLAALLRDQTPTGTELAQSPLQSKSDVQAKEVADAIRHLLTRPDSYVVRWRD